ncbi:MAG: hypothetical protein PQJ59_14400 [Spirochaetales bacterium]|nr:hypothetical protein [Spirochaetales bacterium]
MKRLFILILLAAFLFSCATTGSSSTSTTTDTEPVPYEEDEFAPGLIKLRRAEVLFFGALPLFYMFTSLGYDTYYDMTSADAPSSTNTELGQKFAITVSLSGILALADFIVGELQDD